MKIIKNNLMLTVSMILLCCGALFVIVACADAGTGDNNNGDGNGNGNGGGSTTAVYTCANGTPTDGTPDGDKDVEQCKSCNNYYRLNDSQQCDATVYTCSNGEAVSGSPRADGHPTTNADIEECSGCNNYYRLSDSKVCVATVYTCVNGAADSSSPMADSHANTTTDVPKCISCSQDGYIVNANHACVEGVGFKAQITADADTITVNSGDFTITPSHDGMLYWILFADGQPATTPTAAQLINGAGDMSVGVARSGATSIAVTANAPVTFTVSGGTITALTDYDLYVALALDNNGTTEQILSNRYDFTTDGHPYICNGGTPADGETQNENTTKCTNCDTGFMFDSVNAICTPQVVGLWKFATDATCSSSCAVTMTDDGTVTWIGNCSATTAPYAPSHTTTYEVDTVDGVPTGLVFNAPDGPLHDYTVDRDGNNFVLNPHSSTEKDTNRYLCPFTPASFTQQPTATTTGPNQRRY